MDDATVSQHRHSFHDIEIVPTRATLVIKAYCRHVFVEHSDCRRPGMRRQ